MIKRKEFARGGKFLSSIVLLTVLIGSFLYPNQIVQSNLQAGPNWLVYIGGDKNVWAAPLDGGNHVQVTLDASQQIRYDFPQWSSDGGQLAFCRYQDETFYDAELWITRFPAVAPTLLLEHIYCSYDWSPTGADLAFTPAEFDSTPGSTLAKGLWMYNVEGRQLYELIPPQNNISFGFPQWSPDGTALLFREMAYEGYGAMYIWEQSSGQIRRFDRIYGRAQWAPDSQRIIAEEALAMGQFDQSSLFLLSRDGYEIGQFTPQPGKLADGPVWSADGQDLFLSLIEGYSWEGQLSRLPVQAPEQINLLNLPGKLVLGAAPDGQHLATAADYPPSQMTVYNLGDGAQRIAVPISSLKIDFTTKVRTQYGLNPYATTVPPAALESEIFNGDEEFVLYLSPEGSLNLYLPEKQQPYVLAQASPEGEAFFVSPSGKQVVFGSQWLFLSVSPEGQLQVARQTLPSPAVDASWPQSETRLAYFSRDGQVLVSDANHQFSLLAQAGETPEWSADGGWLAFCSPDGQLFAAASPDQPILLAPQAECRSGPIHIYNRPYQWSSSQERLAFTVRDSSPEDERDDRQAVLFQPANQEMTPAGSGVVSGWSPDGAFLAIDRLEFMGASGYSYSSVVVDVNGQSWSLGEAHNRSPGLHQWSRTGAYPLYRNLQIPTQPGQAAFRPAEYVFDVSANGQTIVSGEMDGSLLTVYCQTGDRKLRLQVIDMGLVFGAAMPGVESWLSPTGRYALVQSFQEDHFSTSMYFCETDSASQLEGGSVISSAKFSPSGGWAAAVINLDPAVNRIQLIRPGIGNTSYFEAKNYSEIHWIAFDQPRAAEEAGLPAPAGAEPIPDGSFGTVPNPPASGAPGGAVSGNASSTAGQVLLWLLVFAVLLAVLIAVFWRARRTPHKVSTQPLGARPPAPQPIYPTLYESSPALQAGVRLLQQGRKQEAETFFKSILGQDPRSARAWYWLAQCLEDADKKRDCLKRAARLAPLDPEIRQAALALDAAPAVNQAAGPGPSPFAPAQPANLPARDPHTMRPANEPVTLRLAAAARRPLEKILPPDREQAKKPVFLAATGAALLCLLCLGVSLLVIPGLSLGQGRSETFAAPENGEVISPANVDRLEMAGMWSLGAMPDSAAFSPDKKMLAVSTRTGVAVFALPEMTLIKFIDLGTRQYLPVGDTRHADPSGPLSFSSDGRYLLGSRGRLVWRTSDWKEFDFFKDDFLAAEFIGGNRVLALGFRNQLTAWNAATGEILYSVPLGANTTDKRLLVAPDKKQAAVFFRDGELILFDTASGQQLQTITSAHGHPYYGRYSPDSSLLALVMADGSITMLDSRTGQPVTNLAPGEDRPSEIAFSPDSRLVAAIIDNGLRVWQVQDWQIVFDQQEGCLDQPLVFARNSSRLIAGGCGALLAYDTSSWQKTTAPLPPLMHGLNTVLSPDGMYSLFFGADNALLVYNHDTLQEVGRSNRLIGGFTRLTFSPNGRFLAAGADSGWMRLYEYPSGKLVSQFNGKGSINSLAFSMDGKTLAAGYATDANPASAEFGTELWNIPQGTSAYSQTMIFGDTKITYSPDGRSVALQSQLELQLWNTLEPRLTLQTPSTGESLFSPDGAQILNRRDDRTLELYETASGRLLSSWDGYFGYINQLSFSPDGAWVSLQYMNSSSDTMVMVFQTRPALKPAWDAPLLLPYGTQASLVGGEMLRVQYPENQGVELVSIASKAQVNLPLGLNLAYVPFTPDQKRFIWYDQGITYSYDLESQQVNALAVCPYSNSVECQYSFRFHAFSRDGQKILFYYPHGDWLEYSLPTGALLQTGRVTVTPVRSAYYSADGGLIGFSNGSDVVVVDPRSQQVLYAMQDGYSMVSDDDIQIFLAPDGGRIARQDSNGWKIYDMASGQVLEESNCGDSGNNLCTLAPDVQSWTKIDDAGRLMLYQANREAMQLGWLPTDGGLHFFDRGKEQGGRAGYPFYWSPDFSPQPIRLADYQGDTLAVSQNGQVAAESDSDTINLSRAGTNAQGCQAQLNGRTGWMSLTADGELLAVEVDRQIQLWEVSSCTLRSAYLRQNDDQIYGLVFHPDGKLLVVSEYSQAVFIDTQTGAQVSSIPSRLGGWRSVVFSKNGKLLIAGTEGGALEFWKVGIGSNWHD